MKVEFCGRITIFFALIVAIPVVVIVGVLLALKDRIRQIEGGEEDAASKY